MPYAPMEDHVGAVTQCRRINDVEDWSWECSGHRLTTVLKTNVDLVDSHKMSTYQQILTTTIIPGTEQQTYWNRCACNELDGLDRRHYPVPLPELFEPANDLQLRYVENWRRYIDGLLDTQPYKPVSHGEMMATCRPSIKKRYQKAFEDIIRERTIFDKSTSYVKAFIKFEKVPIGKVETGKAPRCIQYRDFKYMYAFKRAFLPITKAIKNCSVKNLFGQPVNTIFTKNLLGSQIAESMRSLWDSFSFCVGVCLDHRNWDGHYDRPLMAVSRNAWLTYEAGGAKKEKRRTLLSRCLDEQFCTRGNTSNGVRYTARGKRCSGEYTTSDENGSANKHILESVFSYLIDLLVSEGKIDADREWKVYFSINGDDSVSYMEFELWQAISKIPNWMQLFRNLNQETEMEIAALNFEQISYCQSSPVYVGDRWLMVKSPMRALSRIAYTDKKLDEKTVLRYYRSLGLCELAISAGVPLLQHLSLRLLELAQGARPIGGVDKTLAKSMNQDKIAYAEILMSTRFSFQAAFGISPREQILIEKIISGRNYNSRQARLLIGKYETYHLH